MIGEFSSLFAIAAALAGGVRWLRIAQREHYIPGSVTRFAVRWWGSRPDNKALSVIMFLSVCAAWAGWWEGTAVAGALSLAAPRGLSYRGRPNARLKWTRRLRTLAVSAALCVILCGVLGGVFGALAGVSALLAFGAPVLVDLALWATTPLERRFSAGFIKDATRRLEKISPRVVAITGSYGKTSTKSYVAHLLSAKYAALASPASFNNAAGLSRTVNDGLKEGTEVLVAEMGTYGPGEIRALCQWLKPEISVITAIGAVHLERMGSIDNIARAKAEILENARVGVLNIDGEHLAAIASEYEKGGGQLIRCSAKDSAADVCVSSYDDKLEIIVHGISIGTVKLPGAFPGNVACAVGVALAMGITTSEIASHISTLANPGHRQQIESTPSGIIVIDDTYNSNPDGSAGALATLQQLGARHRRVVVTPGMVELGAEQSTANETFARQAASIATDIVIVGLTNRRALMNGAAGGQARIVRCANRDEAVSWVNGNLMPGDAVLYENDLPDHYP